MFKNITLFSLLFITNLATAAPQRFNFLFAEDGGTAQAEGNIVFEMTLLPNPGGNFYNIPDPLILDLYVEVTGSSGGDGIFTIDDFNGVVFDTGSLALDFNSELVGQPTGNGPWGTSNGGPGPILTNNKTTYDINGDGGPGSGSGDFNLFGILQPPPNVKATIDKNNKAILGGNPPPIGVGPYVLQAASGESMAIVSFLGPQTQSVPALNSLSIMLIAFTLLLIGLFNFKTIKP